VVSKKVKLREQFLKDKEKYRKGILTKSEFNDIKNTYENQKTSIENRQLYELATAPKEKVIGNNIQEAAAQTLMQRQSIAQPQPSQEITQVSNQYGQTYKGKVVGDRFIGVRPVSKREQQLKASTRAGFYSVLNPSFTESKTKAKVIAEQTAIRGSLGIYSPQPLSSDVKYTFTRKEVTTQEPKFTGLKPYLAYQGVSFFSGFAGRTKEIVSNPVKETVNYGKGLARLGLFPIYAKDIAKDFSNTGKAFVSRPGETLGRASVDFIILKGVERGVSRPVPIVKEIDLAGGGGSGINRPSVFGNRPINPFANKGVGSGGISVGAASPNLEQFGKGMNRLKEVSLGKGFSMKENKLGALVGRQKQGQAQYLVTEEILAPPIQLQKELSITIGKSKISPLLKSQTILSSQTQQPLKQQLVIKQSLFQSQTQKQQQNVKLEYSTVQKQTTLFKLKQFQAQRQRQTQVQSQVQLQKQFQVQTSVLKRIPPPFFNYFPKSSKKQPKSLFGKGLKISQPKAYLPSLRASFFGLKGKKDDSLTGLEERLL